MKSQSLPLIQSNIPIPPRSSNVNPNSLSSLLRKLEPGDSIVLPRAEREGIHARAEAAKVKITTRVLDADSFRVWRVG
jgi:hypothetical protein